MTQAGREIIVRRTPDLRQAEEWSLVLEAGGLAPRLTRTSSGWVLSVPSQHLERAADLAPENLSWRLQRAQVRASSGNTAGAVEELGAFALLELFEVPVGHDVRLS